ncbi:MAG: CheR family methyltransferase [Bacteroidales bacterium]
MKENFNLQATFSAALTDKEFNQLSEFISGSSGIKMPPVKRIMLQSRLQKRLRHLKMHSFKEYIEYLFSQEGQKKELVHMLDVVSTNKTDFFREPVHFEFLREHALPEYRQKFQSNRKMKIWSAGCSSGEEPYTIAITMEEWKSENPGFDYSIVGTDISTDILKQAVQAIYKEEKVDVVPQILKKKYLLKSKDRQHPTVRIVAPLRKKVAYYRLNFMDATYNLQDMFDVIFCRNVLIYFTRETQEEVLRKLCSRLHPGGYLFIGHSESIMSMTLPLKQIRPTIFQRT